MNIRIRISKTIANEYDSNAIFDFISSSGVYNLTRAQAQELLDDALCNALHTSAMPSGTHRAYSSLATNLMAQLNT